MTTHFYNLEGQGVGKKHFIIYLGFRLKINVQSGRTDCSCVITYIIIVDTYTELE